MIINTRGIHDTGIINMHTLINMDDRKVEMDGTHTVYTNQKKTGFVLFTPIQYPQIHIIWPNPISTDTYYFAIIEYP